MWKKCTSRSLYSPKPLPLLLHDGTANWSGSIYLHSCHCYQDRQSISQAIDSLTYATDPKTVCNPRFFPGPSRWNSWPAKLYLPPKSSLVPQDGTYVWPGCIYHNNNHWSPQNGTYVWPGCIYPKNRHWSPQEQLIGQAIASCTIPNSPYTVSTPRIVTGPSRVNICLARLYLSHKSSLVPQDETADRPGCI